MRTLIVLVAALLLSGCYGITANPAAPAQIVARPDPAPPSVPDRAPLPLTVDLQIGRADVMRGSGVSLVALTTGTPIAPAIYTWTFGDGTPTETTSTGSSGHMYAQSGDFTASVALADGSGRAAHSSRLISVGSPPRAPTPPAPVPTPPAGYVVTLACAPQSAGNSTPCNVNVSYNDGRLPSAAVTNVDWDWGDGEKLATRRPVAAHPYAGAGSYTVFATVTAMTKVGLQTETVSTTFAVP